MTTDCYVIFNADDFGASTGVNRGIVECHRRGVVTSTSLMVTGGAVDEAVELVAELPGLSIGLHFDVWGEDEREFDLGNHAAVTDEFRRQLDSFGRRLDRMPTHVDSHRHAHLEPGVFDVFRELVGQLGVPLRGDGAVAFIGGFYAQWEWLVTDLDHVSVPALVRILRAEVAPGWTELSCHPGYRSPDYAAVYLAEREEEVRTLTSPVVASTIEDLGITLASYADYPGAART